MAGTFALIALVVLGIPNDFSERMLEEQKKQKELERQSELAETIEESTPTEMSGAEAMEENPSNVNP